MGLIEPENPIKSNPNDIFIVWLGEKKNTIQKESIEGLLSQPTQLPGNKQHCPSSMVYPRYTHI